MESAVPQCTWKIPREVENALQQDSRTAWGLNCNYRHPEPKVQRHDDGRMDDKATDEKTTALRESRLAFWSRPLDALNAATRVIDMASREVIVSQIFFPAALLSPKTQLVRFSSDQHPRLDGVALATTKVRWCGGFVWTCLLAPQLDSIAAREVQQGSHKVSRCLCRREGAPEDVSPLCPPAIYSDGNLEYIEKGFSIGTEPLCVRSLD